jgi:hypothetical protein
VPRNSDLVISYQPSDGDGADEGDGAASIDSTVPTHQVFIGSYSAPTARVTLEARPRKAAYGGAVEVSGTVETPGDVSVAIYRRDAGSDAAVKVAKTTAVARYGIAEFEAVIPRLKKNVTLIARTGASDGMLPGSASIKVRVGARVWLSWTTRLAVHVRPGDADGTARLQRKEDGVWTGYKTVKIVDGEGFTRLPKGTHRLRARFSGSDVCAAGTSRAYTITVR